MKTQFTIYPVGIIYKTEASTQIKVFDEYKEALTGLDEFSHMEVYYWFDHNDLPEKRKMLKVHPRKDPKNPLTGVFATYSPVRPNLIGVTVCKILSIENTTITTDDIDAYDATPVIDIKCHTPRHISEGPLKVPYWAKLHNP